MLSKMHEVSVVVTELAHSLGQLLNKTWVKFFCFCVLLLFCAFIMIYRFSPKYVQLDCPFKIPSTNQLPETKGDANNLDKCMELEIASTNSAMTLGLSGRKSMNRNHGMLFDFAKPDEYCMWMKDMNFSLDIIWLDQSKEIVHMIENISPETFDQTFCGPTSARYVIEVNAGIVKAADLHIGQRIQL